MLLHLPIAIAATLSPVLVSDTAVPQFDIARECRFEGEEIVEFGRCSEDERAAFLDLQKTWAEYANADKRTCTASVTIGGFVSYVELLTCLEMARDVKSGDSSSRGQQATEARRSHGPSPAAGVGKDPITSEKAPDKGIR